MLEFMFINFASDNSRIFVDGTQMRIIAVSHATASCDAPVYAQAFAGTKQRFEQLAWGCYPKMLQPGI